MRLSRHLHATSVCSKAWIPVRRPVIQIVKATQQSLGCCSHHHEPAKTRGTTQAFIFNTLLRGSGFLQYSHTVAHSIQAALFSAALLISAALVHVCAPACALGTVDTVESIFASACVLGSLLISSIPAYVDAIVQAIDAKVDAHTLMALAGTGSFALGLPLEGALLFFLFHFAHVLEHKFVHTAERNLSSLMDALPERTRQVFQLPDGSIDWSSQKSVKVGSLEAGSFVIIKPGDVVPLDGTVVEGSALVGQENVTGESLPVLKRKGSQIVSGGQVYDGSLVFLTETTVQNSLTARIAAMTQHAIEHKAKVETFLSGLMRKWSQTVIVITVALLALLLVAGVPLHGKHGALYRSLAVLTAGAPCALVLTPLAFVCAMAVLSRQGVLVKGGSVLDQLSQTNFVVLDKTGTLTEGKLNFSKDIQVKRSKTLVSSPLTVAAALSFLGTHPVCDAVLVEYAAKVSGKQEKLPKVTEFKTFPGAGMSGKLGGLVYHFGSQDHVAQFLADDEAEAVAAAVGKHGEGQVCSVLVGKRLWGGSENSALRAQVLHLFTFSDKPKRGSGAGVKAIRDMCGGLRVFTGDNATSAKMMALQVGVEPTEIKSDLTPEMKAQQIDMLQKDSKSVLMVGDGLNDAPALAQADVSAAFVDSPDSSVASAADVVILRDGCNVSGTPSTPSDMGRVAFLISLARSVRINVLQNLSIAIISMACAIVPSVFGLLPLWVTVLLHEGSTVLVALNSCRLLFKRPDVQIV